MKSQQITFVFHVKSYLTIARIEASNADFITVLETPHDTQKVVYGLKLVRGCEYVWAGIDDVSRIKFYREKALLCWNVANFCDQLLVMPEKVSGLINTNLKKADYVVKAAHHVCYAVDLAGKSIDTSTRELLVKAAKLARELGVSEAHLMPTFKEIEMAGYGKWRGQSTIASIFEGFINLHGVNWLNNTMGFMSQETMMALQDYWGFGDRYMDSPLLQCLVQKGITQVKASNAEGDGTSSFEAKGSDLRPRTLLMVFKSEHLSTLMLTCQVFRQTDIDSTFWTHTQSLTRVEIAMAR